MKGAGRGAAYSKQGRRWRAGHQERRSLQDAGSRGHWLRPSTTLLSKLLIDSTVRARLLRRLLFNLSLRDPSLDTQEPLVTSSGLISRQSSLCLTPGWFGLFKRCRESSNGFIRHLMLGKNYKQHIFLLVLKRITSDDILIQINKIVVFFIEN